jgi:hypothetical protein
MRSFVTASIMQAAAINNLRNQEAFTLIGCFFFCALLGLPKCCSGPMRPIAPPAAGQNARTVPSYSNLKQMFLDQFCLQFVQQCSVFIGINP